MIFCDPRAYTVVGPTGAAKLPSCQYLIVHALAVGQGDFINSRDICDALRDKGYITDLVGLRAQMFHIKKKLVGTGAEIEGRKHYGYRIKEAENDPKNASRVTHN